MAKSIEQLLRLARNPHYKMSEAEKQQLAEAQKDDQYSTVPLAPPEEPESNSKARRVKQKGSVPVKETGQLDKNIGDPVKE